MSAKYNKFGGTEKTPLKHTGKRLQQNSERSITLEQTREEDITSAAVTNPPENNDKELEMKVFTFYGASKNQKLLLIFCTTANFLATCAFSLLTPFFPLEAEKKEVSQTMVGFILSVYKLILFILSPLIGHYMMKFGIKFIYVFGILVVGVASILLGVLDKGPDGTAFIVMCVLCRSAEAIGFAGSVTASMVIMSKEFPGHVGTVYAILETGAGFGIMCGPVIGGALYEVGGYGLPFFVIGTLIVINGIVTYFILPRNQDVEEETNQKKSILKLIRNPVVAIVLMGMFVGAVGLTALDSTLTKHIESFKLDAVVVGLLFIIGPVTYKMTASLWRYLTDEKGYLTQMTISGYLIFAVGFLFCGPSQILPFIPFKTWSVIVGLILIGISLGCLYIPTMKCINLAANKAGYDKSTETFAMISGVFNSVMAFGGFIGPLVGAAVAEGYSSSISYTSISISGILALFIFLGFCAFQYFTKDRTLRCVDISVILERERDNNDDNDHVDNKKNNESKNRDPEEGPSNASRRTSLSTSLHSGVPALSLSTSLSDHSISSATNREITTDNKALPQSTCATVTEK